MNNDTNTYLGEIVAVLHEIHCELARAVKDGCGITAEEAMQRTGEAIRGSEDTPAGRIGWWRSPLLSGRYLVREVEDGWSRDDADAPHFQAKYHPDAVFTPIATLPEGHAAVDREDLHCAVTVLDALDPFLDPNTERWLIRLRATLDRSQS